MEGVPATQPMSSGSSDDEVEQDHDEEMMQEEPSGSGSESGEASPKKPTLTEYLSDKGLEWFFDEKDVDLPTRVALCRTYASYLVAKGATGRARPGPSPGVSKAKRARHGN